MLAAARSLWGVFQSKAGVSGWQEQNVSVCVTGTSLSDFRKHVARWAGELCDPAGRFGRGPWLVTVNTDDDEGENYYLLLHKEDVSEVVCNLHVEIPI